MKITLLSLIYFLSVLAFAKVNQINPELDTILILKNANVIDVSKGRFQKDKAIIIKNGDIVKIVRIPKKMENAKILDCNGQYIIPDLIDTHIHVTALHKNSIEKTYSYLEYYL
ncbi:hypothetical protein [Pedobacter agri]|uniref:hypothetical protein n=1 Tax=Pedobacter agri TaxID=454586 RepID=UPI0029314C06|nr:hypothetical protein [Pedobacter agri]